MVTSGDYSDYNVVGIFSTEQKALDAIKEHNASKVNEYYQWHDEPQEMEVDEFVGASRHKVYGTHIDQDGATKEDEYPCELFVKPRYTEVTTNESRNRGKTTWSCFARSAVSQDHAHKIAVEARQEWLRAQAILGDNLTK